jgi:hypothetical protein
MQRLKYLITTIYLILSILMFCGCGGKDFNYVPEPGEVKPGPGLISGSDGVFKLYGKSSDSAPEEIPEEDAGKN